MPLNEQQASEFEAAIAAYAFPAVYFDFRARVEVPAGNMLAVEAAIREMLVSTSIERIRDGLANVIYWGYAQVGYRDYRVRRFRDKATDDQLCRFRALLGSRGFVGLAPLAALGLPEFSGISFVSKILTFLDPVRYCVLDKQLLKLAEVPGNRALHRLSAGTQIRVTASNERAYDAWRDECADISAKYFGGRYRVVDVERGFFQLVQAGHLALAQQLYAAAYTQMQPTRADLRTRAAHLGRWTDEAMSDIPVAQYRRTSYENFVAVCPWCGGENIFNRASDLHTFEPIAGLDVSCERAYCGKSFRISGDSVNGPHEMLIFDCYELLERKHYMHGLLSLAQAYEVFFGLFFRVELLYKPFGADPDRDVAELNKLSEALQEKIKGHAFSRMRSLVLHYMSTRPEPKNLDEAAAVIAALPDQPADPSDDALDGLSDAKLARLLKALKATTIHTLRNRVVHKQAYRPTLEEVKAALKETRSVLLPLTNYLDLHDEVNWYMRDS